MRDRPIYITLLCWVLIAINAWALAHSFATLQSPATKARMAANPLPLPVQTAQFFLAMVVPIVTGIFMYEGQNWARVTYIAWGIVHYLLAAAVVPNKRDLIPALPIFAVCAIILMLPRPRAYFLLPRHFT